MSEKSRSRRTEWRLSPHAQMRLQQRGVRRDAWDLIERYGETLEHQKGGRERIALKQETCRELHAKGYSPQAISDAERINLVVAPDGTVITCLHNRRGCRSRRRRGRC